jgi:valyl-tRNA synthetase
MDTIVTVFLFGFLAWCIARPLWFLFSFPVWLVDFWRRTHPPEK